MNSHASAQDTQNQSDDGLKTKTPNLLDDVKIEIRKKTTLKSIQDGITFEERDIYYQTLGDLSELPADQLKALSQTNLKDKWGKSRFKAKPFHEFPIYVDLFNNPETYHGELVTLRGHAQRVVKTSAGENKSGITDLYEVWMFTEDSQSNPAVIVTPTIPDSLPIGDEITDHITVSGIFFKFYTYTAQDTKRFAPLILAGTIELKAPTTQSKQKNSEDTQVTLLFIGQFALLLVVAIAVGFFWGKIGTRRRMKEFELESVGHEPPDSHLESSTESDDVTNDSTSDDKST